MKYLFFIFPCFILLNSCTIPVNSDPDLQDFNPRYYEDWSCKDLSNELSYVLGRLKQRHHQLTSREGSDIALTATGFAIFPPTLLLVQVIQTSSDTDFSMLVKHARAISQTAQSKACSGIPKIDIKETK